MHDREKPGGRCAVIGDGVSLLGRFESRDHPLTSWASADGPALLHGLLGSRIPVDSVRPRRRAYLSQDGLVVDAGVDNGALFQVLLILFALLNSHVVLLQVVIALKALHPLCPEVT